MASILSVFTLFTVLAISVISITEAYNDGNGYGFRVNLMHRDSPNSPLYDPSETHFDRLRNAFRRSFTRIVRFNNNNLKSSSSSISPSPSPSVSSLSPAAAIADIIPANGEYLMNISIGTPPFQILGIADTGSDLIWTQCKPCTHCYKQNSPIFDPSNSSTYREIQCGTNTCEAAGGESCGYQPVVNGAEDSLKTSPKTNSCQYTCSYGDQSYTNGVIAVDSLSLESTSSRPVILKNAIFGCGTNNDGTFNGEGSGIIGLGGGSASFISQMGSSINGAFSYCLIPLSDSPSSHVSSSKINFGINGVVSGEGVVSTGLIEKSPKTFYYLTLEAITIGTEKINFEESTNSAVSEGNIIIDSGTTLTLLPQQFYSRIEASMIRQIGKQEVRAPDQDLSLCYESKLELEVPAVTVHFAGADVKLNSYNTFVRVSENVICFAFAAIQDLAIYGNVAQMNFLVGYDSQQMTVSFKAADCAAQ